jgi:lysophospholipase L1-like esterase
MNTRKNSEKKPIANIILLIMIAVTTVAVMVMGFVIGGKTQHPIEDFMKYIRSGGSIGTDFTDPDSTDEETDDPNTETSEEPPVPTETEDSGSISTNNDPGITTGTEPVPDTQSEEQPGTSDKVPDTKKPDTSDKKTESATVTIAPDIRKDPSERVTVPEIEEPSERVNDPDYFSDALFIGDSLTVGLSSAGKIEGATYFAKTSMSPSSALKSTAETITDKKITLTQYLTNHKFGKIYILLGINGMGSQLSKSQSAYKKLLETILTLQPDAIIIIQSVFHVTAKKSASSPSFRNSVIEAYNDMLKGFVDSKTIFFLDTEGIFDDDTGCMRADWSRDGVHIYMKYYKIWKEVILNDGKF